MQKLDPGTGNNKAVDNLPADGITLSESWRSAFGQLSAGCLGDARAVIILGERGLGKSALISAWREVSKTAFNIIELKNAAGEPDKVVAELGHLLGIDTADLGRSAILGGITKAILAERESGRETAVIIENADKLPANTLELLMVIARDRNAKKPLLRYIISGTDALRKPMRLEGGNLRRQSYEIIELKRFSEQQTKDFVTANLARSPGVTIAEDAAVYLHESTSGRPANVLSVLDKLRRARLEAGESEISRAHVQALVKAPKPAAGKGRPPADVGAKSSAKEIGGAVPDGSGDFARDLKRRVESAKGDDDIGIGSASNLPESIRDVNDPRPLLRWAFGLDEHSETAALSERASAGRSAPTESAPRAETQDELNAALARVAERELAEKNGTGAEEGPASRLRAAVETAPAAPVVAKSANTDIALENVRVGDETLKSMIESEAFTFSATKPEPPTAVEAPEQLSRALRERHDEPSRRGNRFVLAAGVAVMGIASLGVLWTALQPNEIVNPLEATLGAPSVQDVPATAARTETASAPTAPATAVPANTNAETSGPDIATELARLKSPDAFLGPETSDSRFEPFRDQDPRSFQTAYLTPARVDRTEENLDLRRSLVAEMVEAERVEFAGEERRLTEQLASLESELAQKQNTLNGLERAISAISTQTQERGDLLDSRAAEIEVVTGQLAFIARDRATAEARLEDVTSQALAAEERLQVMRDELAAAEALIVENRALLDQNKTTTADLGEAVARREAEYAELNRKIEETDALLIARRQELASVETQQAEARETLSDLELQLEESQIAQDAARAELEQLLSERDAQIAAATALDADVRAASARLKEANAQLDSATAALSDRTNALSDIETQTNLAQRDLESLIQQLAQREALMNASSAELSALENNKRALQADLALKNTEIEEANIALRTLTENKQTATEEFERLTQQRAGLERDLARSSVALDTVQGELSQKQSEIAAIGAQLNEGTAAITAQRSQLANLRAQGDELAAAQSSAQAVVNQGQDQVQAATGELAVLRDERSAISNELSVLESRFEEAKAQIDAVESSKVEAEREISATIARLKDIKVQESSAEAELANKQAQLQDLQARIESSNKELEFVAERRAALGDELTTLANDGAGALRERQAELARIEAELAARKAELASVNQDLAQQNASSGAGAGGGAIVTAALDAPAAQSATEAVSAPQPATQVAAGGGSEPAAAAAQDVTGGLAGASIAPRDADLVRAALADAPGLGRAAQIQKDELQAALVRGECVTDALKATFGRVNPHTLVALLENMEMCGS